MTYHDRTRPPLPPEPRRADPDAPFIAFACFLLCLSACGLLCWAVS